MSPLSVIPQNIQRLGLRFDSSATFLPDPNPETSIDIPPEVCIAFAELVHPDPKLTVTHVDD